MFIQFCLHLLPFLLHFVVVYQNDYTISHNSTQIVKLIHQWNAIEVNFQIKSSCLQCLKTRSMKRQTMFQENKSHYALSIYRTRCAMNAGLSFENTNWKMLWYIKTYTDNSSMKSLKLHEWFILIFCWINQGHRPICSKLSFATFVYSNPGIGEVSRGQKCYWPQRPLKQRKFMKIRWHPMKVIRNNSYSSIITEFLLFVCETLVYFP